MFSDDSWSLSPDVLVYAAWALKSIADIEVDSHCWSGTLIASATLSSIPAALRAACESSMLPPVTKATFLYAGCSGKTSQSEIGRVIRIP